jgi:hypothetical protein
LPSIVGDTLVDQRQDSGGGGVLPSVSANFDTHDKFTLAVSAPAGHKFLVRPPPGQAVRFSGGMSWQGNSTNGASQDGSLAVSFVGSEGIAPDFSASQSALLSDFHGVVGFKHSVISNCL